MEHALKMMVTCTLLMSTIVSCRPAGEEKPDATPNPPNNALKEDVSSPPASQPSRVTAVIIPNDVTYAIISSEIIPGIKRGLEVRLNRKVSEEVLRSIAMELKARDSTKYRRTFIGYYLPGMEVGAGAWATTHFDPGLEVRILGLTIEQERDLVSEKVDPSQDIVGIWLDESLFIGSRLTLYRQNGKLVLERKFGDGSSSSEEMTETLSSKGRRLQEKRGSSFGEYYLIDKQGNLQSWDHEGLISTARAIKKW